MRAILPARKRQSVRKLTRAMIEQAAENVKRKADLESSSLVISDRITLSAVIAFLDNESTILPVRIKFIADLLESKVAIGKLIIEELTESQTHLQVKLWFLMCFYGNDQVISCQEFRCNLGAMLKIADAAIVPRRSVVGLNGVLDNGFGKTCPNVVLEVAYKIESLDMLVEELLNWLCDGFLSVQVAIGIKIDKISSSDVRMKALVYRRNNQAMNPQLSKITAAGLNHYFDPDQEIDFGTNILNRAGLSVHFPQAELFWGVAAADIPLEIHTLIASNGDVVLPLDLLHEKIMMIID
jgi:hypothetical protein